MDEQGQSSAADFVKPLKMFGRFELKHLISKTESLFTWRALDTQSKLEVLLCQPRKPFTKKHLLELWLQDASKASKLKHPRLVEIGEAGQINGQAFVCYQLGDKVNLVEHLASTQNPATVIDMVQWTADILDALAFVHESRLTHQDLGMASVLIDSAGRAHLVGVGAAVNEDAPSDHLSSVALQKHRADAEFDLLMVGLLMYRQLAGVPALEEPDLRKAAFRIGKEIVRLPWNTPQQVPETLRAIVNRATDRQHRQRYLNARTLLSTLEGWIKVNGKGGVDPLALFLDRINSVGHLPGTDPKPGAYNKMLAENLRIDDVVDMMVAEPSMCWELLRVVNTSLFHLGGDDGTSSLCRAVVLIGQLGLRKVCGSLRPWPGVLNATASIQNAETGSIAINKLQKEFKLTCVAAKIARFLRPFNIADDEVMVAAMSQRLGRLLILYHYPEESLQITNLMSDAPGSGLESKPTPGMSYEAACGAVLGINPDELTLAVLKHWRYPDYLLQAVRPLSLKTSPKRPKSDIDWLCTVASMSNELGLLADMTPEERTKSWPNILSRYSRITLTSQPEMAQALYKAVQSVDPQWSRLIFPAGIEKNVSSVASV